jgi:hypothetical protein
MTVYAETKFVLEGNVRLQVEQAPMCLPGAPAASVTAPAVQAATGKGMRPAEAPKPPGSAGAPKELSMSVSLPGPICRSFLSIPVFSPSLVRPMDH